MPILPGFFLVYFLQTDFLRPKLPRTVSDREGLVQPTKFTEFTS